MNHIKFTYDKLESVKFRFSIFDIFSQVLSHLLTFLINIRNQEIYNILECLGKIQNYNSVYPSNGQTNKQTNKK